MQDKTPFNFFWEENKEPRNEQGEPHGQWMCYHKVPSLWFMDNNINGDVYGYGVYQERDEVGEIIYVKEYYAR